MHASPDAREITACRWWLDIERAEVAAPVTVVMGASAARAVLGRAVAIMKERGRPIAHDHGQLIVTVHPSFLLRVPDAAAKRREYAAFVADLRQAASLAAGTPGLPGHAGSR
jgi:DNA polymerase